MIMSGIGFTIISCTECGCEANSCHYPGCSLAPYVCPGCHAVGERCAPGCIDAQIEAEREDRLSRESDYDWAEINDVEDWEYAP